MEASLGVHRCGNPVQTTLWSKRIGGRSAFTAHQSSDWIAAVGRSGSVAAGRQQHLTPTPGSRSHDTVAARPPTCITHLRISPTHGTLLAMATQTAYCCRLNGAVPKARFRSGK